MKEDDENGGAEDFAKTIDETLDVFDLIYRRWQPDEAWAREESLPADHPLAVSMKEIWRDEIEEYFNQRGLWATFDVEKYQRTEPYRFWNDRAPRKSLLRFFALKITSLDPVTSRVERMHKRFAANRTKLRSTLRFSVNQSLAFLNDTIHNQAKGELDMD